MIVKELKRPPNEGLIKMLRDLLAAAESGELTGVFAFTWMHRDGAIGRAWGGDASANIFTTYGTLIGEAQLWFLDQIAQQNKGKVR